MANSTINIFGSSGEAMVGADTINSILASMDSKLTSDDINIETLGDGTVDVDVKNDTYTINLNHTHENMAKIVKCTEATLPQTMADDTIYVQVDNLTTPTEIEALHIFGLEFTGGGGAAPGTPRLTSPTASQISNGIDIGNTTSGVATYSFNIKAKDLTQSLLVEWGSGSTGYSFNTSNLPTGVTYDSGTGKLTITKEAACGINGVNIPVVYTGNDTDENAEGTIGISSSSVDGINVEVTLVANKVTYEDLAAVKLTGTQWLQTDYYPNSNTEFELTCHFEANSHTNQSGANTSFLRCLYDIAAQDERFAVYSGTTGEYNYSAYRIFFINKPGSGPYALSYDNAKKHSRMTIDNAVIRYSKGSSNGTLSFTAGGSTDSVQTSLKTETMSEPMQIGYRQDTNAIYNAFDLTIYALTITENGQPVRRWVPKLRNGTIPGLYDLVNNKFISSETAKTSGLASDELVAIPLPNNS